ncbi:ABC transporter substrate-binding protein [Kaistia dalseonensis]|uniref:Peptide/nickel transport system substrate-binding protein n=1 Tax=Kaistia dalseonensis TaxID=410840 RepID=A0ABU0HAP1_9HYPH|nr:ABC transporter substrate-binding protein [Kaistia dalseonensis]MCX5496709.1 ABC transporter substrate-binding protein [Kaistia dalseonensis]MDQ0439335.1 peptide/nickel transport system substrate-binding protein [Kaistia dalseonensis]
MSEVDKGPKGLTRRGVFKAGAGVALGVSLFGFLDREAQAAEQVLKIAHGGFDMDWSPMRGGGRPFRWQSLWWASPMRFDSSGAIQPYVVTSWEPSADLTTWTFHLDPKAVFSDGSPITAADIKGSWELAAMPSSKHQRVNQVAANIVGYDEIVAGTAKEMPGLVAKDDKTLVVTLKAADPIFFMRIANHLIPIVKASEARDADGNEVLEWWSPEGGGVTSGPFKITSLDLDAGKIGFAPNENFFGEKPKLSGVEIQVVEDPVAATALLQKGEMQAHTELVTSTIIKDLGKEFSAGPQIPTGQHFWFNVNAAPLNDPKVRQALIMAVDREGLIKASFPDGPHKKTDMVLTAVPGIDDPKYVPFPYDPAAAKKALAESSYGGPERLPKLILAGTTTPAITAAAQFMIEQWRQNLGITAVELKPTIDNFNPADVHIFRDDAGTRVPDAATYLMSSIHSSSGIAKGKMNGYKNPEVDRLLEEAITKPADDPQRVALAQEAQRLFRDDYAFIPWYGETMSRWALPNVKAMDKNLDWQVVAPWAIEIE